MSLLAGKRIRRWNGDERDLIGRPRQIRTNPMRASLYYALQRRWLRAQLYDALGLRRAP